MAILATRSDDTVSEYLIIVMCSSIRKQAPNFVEPLGNPFALRFYVHLRSSKPSYPKNFIEISFFKPVIFPITLLELIGILFRHDNWRLL